MTAANRLPRVGFAFHPECFSEAYLLQTKAGNPGVRIRSFTIQTQQLVQRLGRALDTSLAISLDHLNKQQHGSHVLPGHEDQLPQPLDNQY